MFGSDVLSAPGSESVAHIIQVALTPVFLLSGVASLLGVFAGRLARVADRVDALTEKLAGASQANAVSLEQRLAYLKKRSRVLDVAVVLGAVAGVATCAAALLLFIGTLQDHTVKGALFIAFGMALLFTMGALTAFTIEMLIASRGTRDRVAHRREEPESAETPEPEAGAETHDGSTVPLFAQD